MQDCQNSLGAINSDETTAVAAPAFVWRCGPMVLAVASDRKSHILLPAWQIETWADIIAIEY